MPADDKVRVEVAYESGQSFTTLMSIEAADDLERRTVALLAALDELAHLRSRSALLCRLGHSKKSCPAA